MKAAARLKGRVTKLVLLEPNPVSLLAQAGRTEAFADAMAMCDCIKKFGTLGEWQVAAANVRGLLGRRWILGGHAARAA